MRIYQLLRKIERGRTDMDAPNDRFAPHKSQSLCKESLYLKENGIDVRVDKK